MLEVLMPDYTLFFSCTLLAKKQINILGLTISQDLRQTKVYNSDTKNSDLLTVCLQI